MSASKYILLGLVAAFPLMQANAQVAAQPALKKDTPIEISSDKLDVIQAENKAIFTGNVIAIQGTTNMRSAEMVVFYRNSGDTAPAADGAAPTPQGIYRIDAQGNVVFTTPAETALGDKAVYNVDADTIDLYGANVTLTRGKNVLKGTKLNYNVTTGRSILTGGATDTATPAGKPARVHGLFMPKSDAPKPAVKP